MSSIEELREKLIKEAGEKADEIIKEAEKKAEEIIAAAEAEWMNKADNTRRKIIEESKTRARIIISEARRKARLIINEEKNKVLEKIYEDAWSRIKERRGYDIESSLRNLLEEALTYIEQPKNVLVNPVDKNIIEKILAEKDLKNITVTGNINITGGVIVESVKGERIDNTYDTRFMRAKEILKPLIAKILWG